jgi:hypothetical protein
LRASPSQLRKRPPVYQLERFPTRKLQRIPRKTSRCYEDAPIRAFGGHDPEKLANALDRHLPVLPVLTLDDDALAASGQLKVNSAIRLGSAALDNREALPTVGFADESLKICPVELTDGFQAVRPR